MSVQLIRGDCLEVMKGIAPASVDACITDPPYGTTACAWDSVIPFAPMWANLKRIVKRNGAIVLFGSQPFTSALVMSNPGMFGYGLIWEKSRPTGFFDCDDKPLKSHEEISVFYHSLPVYNPQRNEGAANHRTKPVQSVNTIWSQAGEQSVNTSTLKYPRSVIYFSSLNHPIHTTQKPVELLRYLIRTYTNEGDTVLDFTMGSGTTGVACVIERRNFIGIEKDEGYFSVAEARIKRAQGQPCDIPKRAMPERDLPLFRGEAA